MRHVVLTKEEVAKLTSIQKHGKHSLERQRSMCLLLSHQRHSMAAVAKLMNIGRLTVVRLLDAWDAAAIEQRFDVLYREPGQGAKKKPDSVKEQLPEMLERNNRDTKLLPDDLEKNHHIKVCKVTLQNFLKGTGVCLQTCS
jgi:transposase